MINLCKISAQFTLHKVYLNAAETNNLMFDSHQKPINKGDIDMTR